MKEWLAISAVASIVICSFFAGLFSGWFFTKEHANTREYLRGVAEGKAYVLDDIRNDEQKKKLTELKSR